MSALSALTIRHSLRSATPLLRPQRRWARVYDVRFVTTTQRSSQILEKYKSKLQQKAKEEGHEDITSLKEAYKEKIEETRQQAFGPPPGTHDSGSAQARPSSLHQPPPPAPQPQVSTPDGSTASSKNHPPSGTGIKPLSSYLDLAKVSTLPKKEIEYIWRLRHANDPLSLCAVIPLETYQRIYKTARSHPHFVLPLPRPESDEGNGDIKQSPQGFEGGERTTADVHFLQWGFHPPAGALESATTNTANTHTSTVIFTHLAAFKLHGTFAQPHTTITHHLDLADSHGMVLLNGSVMKDRGVSVEEGRWLLMCLQKFYDFEGHGGGIGREKRQGLLEKFSKGDSAFSLEELVDEAERIS